MKKKILVFSLSFICNYSFAQLTFSKVFYDSSTWFWIRGNSVVQTPDKGYIIVGSQFFGGLVIKLDSSGGQIWKRYYNQQGGPMLNGFYCIAPTNDSCYIVAGAMSNSLHTNIFCMKIDSLGDTLWTRTLLTPDESVIFSVQQTYDHGYIMAGRYRTGTAPDLSIGVVKLDSTGNLSWSKVITSPGYNNYPNTIKQTPDSGYVVWGTLNNTGTGIYANLIKLSPSGNIQWSKIYNRPSFIVMNGLGMEILNDGIISFSIGDNNPYTGILMKMDFNGNVIWSRSNANLNYTVGAFVSKIHQTKDEGFVIAIGYPISFGWGYIWRADSSGNFLWAKEVVMNPIDAIETYDNGYLILGNGVLPQAGFGVVKTDSIGNAPSCVGGSLALGISDTLVATNFITIAAPMGGAFVHINTTINISSIYDVNNCAYNPGVGLNEINSDKQLFVISPNPSNGKLIITFERIIKNGRVEILNIVGEKLWREIIFNESKKEINLKNISSGIYFVKVFDGEKNFCKKIIVEHN
jgi:hypothetical protein